MRITRLRFRSNGKRLERNFRATWKLVLMAYARLLVFVVSCAYFNEFYDLCSFSFFFFFHLTGWVAGAASASPNKYVWLLFDFNLCCNLYDWNTEKRVLVIYVALWANESIFITSTWSHTISKFQCMQTTYLLYIYTTTNDVGPFCFYFFSRYFRFF